ncbi:MAG: class I SAM-dependent methyltransferase [Halothiobacillus sp.]
MTTTPDFSLPVPSQADQTKSLQLIEHLRARMSAAPLSFAEYMREVLYHPTWGYYSSGQVQFGAGGDFVTAPERSPLFTLGLVYEWQQAQKAGLGSDVCELGAGSGQLALDFLRACALRDCLPHRYWILEISPELRVRQHTRIQAELPTELAARVQWIDRAADLSNVSNRQMSPQIPTWAGGLVIANEVLDAMPAVRFRWRPGILSTVQELKVDVQGVRFAWVAQPVSPPLRAALNDFAGRWPTEDLPDEPVAAEINLALPAWLTEMQAAFGHAQAPSWFYLFDYGGNTAEVYRPDRTDGTLRCHYRHRAHNDPFVYPGLQDITTWVDFETLARRAATAGFHVDGERSQAAWLLGTDVPAQFSTLMAQMMNEDSDRATAAKLAQGFKELVMPTEMGERFRVLRLTLPAHDHP